MIVATSHEYVASDIESNSINRLFVICDAINFFESVALYFEYTCVLICSTSEDMTSEIGVTKIKIQYQPSG